MRHVSVAVGLLAGLAAQAAFAQTGGQETQQPPGPPPGLATPTPLPGNGQADRTVPEQVAPNGVGPKTGGTAGSGAGTGSSGSVGGSGVIHPPTTVDPGIRVTPPASTGQSFPTPVVPPPGSAGGNTQVVPK